MNKQNQLPNVKLQKTSVIFMQLGLILALFIVYIVLEHESYYKPSTLAIYDSVVDSDDDPIIRKFELEKKVIKKKVIKAQPKKVQPEKKVVKSSDKFNLTKDDSKIKEDVDKLLKVDDETENPKKLILDDIDEVDTVEVIEEDIPFVSVEFAPEYPGCKGTKNEKKQCFNDKVRKFVQKKFDASIAQEIGLSSGKQRIDVGFIIDKQGDIVNVRVRSPHKRLEREARRVINLLPKMKPARQSTSTVSVHFNLPIVFLVED